MEKAILGLQPQVDSGLGDYNYEWTPV